MPKISAIENVPGMFTFYCPGCNEHHGVWTEQANGNGAKWGYNGNPESPTFTPSLLIRTGHYIPSELDNKNNRCWCTYAAEHPEEKYIPKCSVCHSFITDGKIQFLNDCTHELAGQTVDIPEVARG